MPAGFAAAQQLLEYARLRREALRHRKDDQLGASAIEWAVISAIVVVAAVLIGNTIRNLVTEKSSEIENN